MKYLATKLAVVQGARAQCKIKTEKIDEGCHPADILTKPLQGKEFEFKRGRLLRLRVTPSTKPSSNGRHGECKRGQGRDLPRPQCASRPGSRNMEPGGREAARPGARLDPAQARAIG